MNATIQVDATLEKEAQELFQRLGLTMTAAVNLFLRQAVLKQALPLSEEDPDTFTEEELLAKHERGLEAIRAGYGITKTMAELEAMARER